MKILAMILSAFVATSIASETFNVTVEVGDIKRDKGNLEIAIFSVDQKEEYPQSDKPFIGFTKAVTEKGRMTVIFENVPKGEYAVSFYHDINKDQKLNTNFVGIPSEPYGFSVERKPLTRASTFDEAKFTVDRSLNLSFDF
ncbi:MAG: DUF2141 domain-containing protein [Cyanothece sp. SIO2G6]|nr:DUF2141 domain-containing protein [Cyanothece sp. SIO2G6]